MSNTDFIESINSQWQQMDVVPGVSVEGARRKRRRVVMSLVGELLLTLVSLVVAFYFWSRQLGFFFNVSGLVLFVSGLHALFINHRITRPVINWSDWSPQGLIEYQATLCSSAISRARYVLFSCLILVLFTVFVWIVSFLSRDLLPLYFKWVYSGITLPIAIGLALWARRRISNKSKEQSKFQELINDYLTADQIDEIQVAS